MGCHGKDEHNRGKRLTGRSAKGRMSLIFAETFRPPRPHERPMTTQSTTLTMIHWQKHTCAQQTTTCRWNSACQRPESFPSLTSDASRPHCPRGDWCSTAIATVAEGAEKDQSVTAGRARAIPAPFFVTDQTAPTDAPEVIR